MIYKETHVKVEAHTGLCSKVEATYEVSPQDAPILKAAQQLWELEDNGIYMESDVTYAMSLLGDYISENRTFIKEEVVGLEPLSEEMAKHYQDIDDMFAETFLLEDQ